VSTPASLLERRSIYTALNPPRNSSPEEEDKLNSLSSVCLPGFITIGKGSSFHKQRGAGSPSPAWLLIPAVAVPQAPGGLLRT